jgi:hypothetical protein
MSGVIHDKFHLDVIFLVGIFFSVDFKKVKDAIQEAHRKYFDDILNTSITDNPKKFYSYIKQKKSGQSNIPVSKRNTVFPLLPP